MSQTHKWYTHITTKLARFVFLLVVLVFSAGFTVSCGQEAPVTEPAPVIPAIPSTKPEQEEPIKELDSEQFSSGVDGWVGFTDNGASSEVS